MAQSAHDGFARALRPAHTRFDGDIAFAVATGAAAEPRITRRSPLSDAARATNIDRLRVAAADVIADGRFAARSRPVA